MTLAERRSTSTAVIEYDASTLFTSWNEQDVCGDGSFATVRKCKHEELGEVAVKCFTIDRSSEKHSKISESVEREVSVLKRLKHENIVKILGITKWANCVGIILEYVNGRSLENLLMDATTEIPWSLRFHIFLDITSGLAYLHNQALVHGDLKPPNIILNVELVAKIADFGSVNITKASQEFNKSINIKSTTQHTPFHASPEVLRDPFKKKQTSMDVYSVGIITYEILTRTSAFEDATNVNVVTQAIMDRGQKPNEKYLRETENSMQNRSEDLSIFKRLENEMLLCWNTDPQKRPNICDVRDRNFGEIDKLDQSNSDAEKIKKMKTFLRDKLQKAESNTKVTLSEFSYPFQMVAISLTSQDTTGIHEERGTDYDQNETRIKNYQEEGENVENQENRNIQYDEEQSLLEDEVQTISGYKKCCQGKYILPVLLFTLLLVAASTVVAIFVSSHTTHQDLECPKLKLPNFLQAVCTNNNYVGSRCKFHCTNGHVVTGPSNISCNTSLRWTSELPNCTCPLCTTGFNCKETTSWKTAKSYIVNDFKNPFTLNYAGFSIRCQISNADILFHWDCTCTDMLFTHSHRCNGYSSLRDSCEHALANLLLDMIRNGTYPEPCDAADMPKGCG